MPPAPAEHHDWLARILLVEDDAELARALGVALEQEYYQVIVAEDGEGALAALSAGSFDLVLLDILLPGVSGFGVCWVIRKTYPDLPVIMITALGDLGDTVLALELGAADYLVKPFGMGELRARLRAVLRRAGINGGPVPVEVSDQLRVVLGGLSLDRATNVLHVDGRSIALSVREAEVLGAFLDRPGLVVTRKTVEGLLGGDASSPSRATIDWYIHQLRQRLSAELGSPVIETVFGVGWRLDPRWDR